MTPEVFAALKEKSAQEVSLAAIPYAGFMGMFLQRNVDDMLVHLKYDIKHIGAPGRYHGGVVGATLEFAAMAQVMWAAYLKGEPVARDSLPKPVTVTVDFLRSAGLCDLYASALSCGRVGGLPPCGQARGKKIAKSLWPKRRCIFLSHKADTPFSSRAYQPF